MENAFMYNNWTSSIMVPYGVKVTLYDANSAYGGNRVYEGGAFTDDD